MMPVLRQKLYLAGPLFSEAELRFNRDLAARLTLYFEVFLPQEDGGLVGDYIAQGMTADEANRKVCDDDMQAIRDSDLVLAVLDGRTVDEGTAFELGFAIGLGKSCYGLQTDPRRLLPSGNNPLIEVPLKRIFRCETEAVEWAQSSFS